MRKERPSELVLSFCLLAAGFATLLAVVLRTAFFLAGLAGGVFFAGDFTVFFAVFSVELVFAGAILFIPLDTI